jgi:hypothetical protein
VIFRLLVLFCLVLGLESSYGFFGFFKKKVHPVVKEEKLSADDKIDYVDRNQKDLSTLKSISVVVPESLNDENVYKIKSVLQYNESIYKVTHTDSKNFVVYFFENKTPDEELVKKIISDAGFKSEVKK